MTPVHLGQVSSYTTAQPLVDHLLKGIRGPGSEGRALEILRHGEAPSARPVPTRNTLISTLDRLAGRAGGESRRYAFKIPSLACALLAPDAKSLVVARGPAQASDAVDFGRLVARQKGASSSRHGTAASIVCEGIRAEATAGQGGSPNPVRTCRNSVRHQQQSRRRHAGDFCK